MAGSIREVGAYGGPVGGEPGGSSGGPPLDPTVAARLQRSEAAARLDAFAASDPCGDGATNQLGRQCDTEINDAALFEKQPGDVDAVDSRDLQQGRLADCYLLAPLAAIARTPEGCAFLRHAIVENKSADGHVVSYTVTLHELQHGRFGITRARDVPVTVDPRFVVGHAGLRLEGSHSEIWPLVVEKACAKYLGGYNQLDRAGSPSDALALLTGRQPQYVSFRSEERRVGK